MFHSSAHNHDESTLIFLHLHKSAGHTVNYVLEREYGPRSIHFFDGLRLRAAIDEFKRLSGDKKLRRRVICGHAPFGIHEAIPRPSVYFTVLREPIDRVISHYHFILGRPHDPLYPVVEKMSLPEYAGRTDNMQTRFLSAWGEPDTLFEDHCPPAMLDRALDNIEKHFALVGLLERFDETLLLLRAIFGWREVFYVNRNVTKRRPQAREVPASARNGIAKFNELDLKLYERVSERFDELVRDQGPDFAQLVERFRDENEAYGRRVDRESIPSSPANR